MKRSKKAKEPVSVAQMFGFSVPPQKLTQYQNAVLHVACDGVVEIENSRGILVYDAARIRLDMGDRQVEIEGDGLVMDTYQKRRISIHGTIFSIRFYFEKERNAHG